MVPLQGCLGLMHGNILIFSSPEPLALDAFEMKFSMYQRLSALYQVLYNPQGLFTQLF